MKWTVWDARHKSCRAGEEGDSFLVPSWTVLPAPCASCSLSGSASPQPILPTSHQLCMLWEGDDCVLKERAVSTSSALGNIPKSWWKKGRSCKAERKLLEGPARGRTARRVGGHPRRVAKAMDIKTEEVKIFRQTLMLVSSQEMQVGWILSNEEGSKKETQNFLRAKCTVAQSISRFRILL